MAAPPVQWPVWQQAAVLRRQHGRPQHHPTARRVVVRKSHLGSTSFLKAMPGSARKTNKKRKKSRIPSRAARAPAVGGASQARKKGSRKEKQGREKSRARAVGGAKPGSKKSAPGSTAPAVGGVAGSKKCADTGRAAALAVAVSDSSQYDDSYYSSSEGHFARSRTPPPWSKPPLDIAEEGSASGAAPVELTQPAVGGRS